MSSYTYGDIQTRIASELNRDDLTSKIQKAIISAIEAYERERFWFNEATSTSITTTAAQNYVSPPADFIKEYFFQITIGGAKYTLRPVSFSDFREMAAQTSSGQPTDYSYYADLLYLFPTPGSTYSLTLDYIKRLTTLSGSSDSNGWTNFAEPLIRERAKADIRTGVLRDKTAIAEATSFAMRGEPYLSTAEKQAYIQVRGESDARIATGIVKARYL